jgi:hypothetical protein
LLGIEVSLHIAPNAQAYVGGLIALKKGKEASENRCWRRRTDVEDVSNGLRWRLGSSGKGVGTSRRFGCHLMNGFNRHASGQATSVTEFEMTWANSKLHGHPYRALNSGYM